MKLKIPASSIINKLSKTDKNFILKDYKNKIFTINKGVVSTSFSPGWIAYFYPNVLNNSIYMLYNLYKIEQEFL